MGRDLASTIPERFCMPYVRQARAVGTLKARVAVPHRRCATQEANLRSLRVTVPRILDILTQFTLVVMWRVKGRLPKRVRTSERAAAEKVKRIQPQTLGLPNSS